MIDTAFNGLDVLYHHAKFGEIEQRAPDVGAKIRCLFIITCLSRSSPARCACVRGVHCSNDHCVAVYGSLLMRFSIFFFVGDRPIRGTT